jgi:hypothetical protein
MGNLRIPSCNAFQVFHHTGIKGDIQDLIPSYLSLSSTEPKQLLDSQHVFAQPTQITIRGRLRAPDPFSRRP